MNTNPANEWREVIMDLGVEVDTHQDGDARIRTFTFNEVQLQAFLDTHSAHLVERIESLRKEVPTQAMYHDEECEYSGFNEALDQAIDIVKGGIR